MPAERGRPPEWTDALRAEAGEKLLAWFASDPNRLFFKTFAHEVYELSWQALYAACKDNHDFSVAHARAKEIQEERIALGGLTEKYNASMASLTLKNVAGWREKSDSDLNLGGKIIVQSSAADERI